jgi:hypothetical protein
MTYQVVKVNNELEMKEILQLARKHQTPVTFRAAGTSLSGQAITDSILLKISHTGKNFRNYQILVRDDPLRLRMPPSPHLPPAVTRGNGKQKETGGAAAPRHASVPSRASGLKRRVARTGETSLH